MEELIHSSAEQQSEKKVLVDITTRLKKNIDALKKNFLDLEKQITGLLDE